MCLREPLSYLASDSQPILEHEEFDLEPSRFRGSDHGSGPVHVDSGICTCSG